MTMDSVLTIIAGLGFRLFIAFVSGDNYKLASSLVGLWEGFVVHHFVSSEASSWDPFIACAFRLFIDFVFTRNKVKVLLIILWTGLGVALSEFVRADQNVESRGRRTTRSSRNTAYPPRWIGTPRVRFDGIEPSTSTPHNHIMTPRTMQTLGPSTTRVTVRNTVPVITTERPIISKPRADIPRETYVMHVMSDPPPSELDPLRTSDTMTSGLPVPHSQPDVDHASGQNTSDNNTSILTPKPPSIDLAKDLPKLPEPDSASGSSSEISLYPSLESERVVSPSPDDDAIQPLDVFGTPKGTRIIHAVQLDLQKPLPPVVDGQPDVPPIDHERTPTKPAMQLPPEIQVNSPSTIDHKIIPPPDEDERHAAVDQPSASFIPPLQSTPRPSSSRAAPLPESEPFPGTRISNDKNILPDTAHTDTESNEATPDNISLTESTLTEAESVITVGDREFVISRATAFREQAIAQERLRDGLKDAMSKSFREGRIREGLLLEGDLQDTENMAKRLHEKAARRYFYAHNNSLIHPPRTIDVHRLRVPEALRETNRAFRKTLLGDGTALRVIVGRGRHSRGKMPVLRKKMMDDMERRQIPHRLDPLNDGVLVIGVDG